MFQRWFHLLFLHWPVSPDMVQGTLPKGLQVDTFDGSAWVGIVPFFMRGVRPAGFMSVPGISNFLELNLRTYVRDLSGRPGIWFYSLDANQAMAVCFARVVFGLPYKLAEMRAWIADRQVDYWSRRCGCETPLHYRYRPLERLGESAFGSLEFFLAERYRLYALRNKKLLTGRVYHSPYQLRKVSVVEASPELFSMDGLESPNTPAAHTMYSDRLDVSIYAMELAASGR